MTPLAPARSGPFQLEASLRGALAAEVAGRVASPPVGLEAVLGSIPRAPFFSCVYEPDRSGPPATWIRQTAEAMGAQRWAAAIHRDRTQVIERSADGTRWRVSLAPSVLATLWSLAGVGSGRRVLELGTTSGYGAAVLGELVGPGGEVHTVEWDAAAAAQARRAIDASVDCPTRITVHHAPADAGHPPGGSYDCIVLNGSAPYVPWPLTHQLAENGRLVMDWRGRWGGGVLVVEKTPSGLAGRFVTALPGALTTLGPDVEVWDAELYRDPRPPSPDGRISTPIDAELATEARFGVFFDAELPFVSLVRGVRIGEETSSFFACDRLSNGVAWFERTEGEAWTARGPRRLAARLRRALESFACWNQPENADFRYVVDDSGQWVVLDTAAGTARWCRSMLPGSGPAPQ